MFFSVRQTLPNNGFSYDDIFNGTNDDNSMSVQQQHWHKSLKTTLQVTSINTQCATTSNDHFDIEAALSQSVCDIV